MDEQTAVEVDAILDRIASSAAETAVTGLENKFLVGQLGSEYLSLQRRQEALKETPGYWYQKPVVGNSDPKKAVPHGTHSWSPGGMGRLTCNGLAGQEDNFYMFMPLLTPATLPRRLTDSRIQRITDPSVWQALEWQSQVKLSGLVHNLAVQAELVNKIWRFFDYTNNRWIAIPVSIPFPDFTKPVETLVEYGLDKETTAHVALTVNGIRYPLNIEQKATVTTDADKMTVAMQVDPKRGATCTVEVSRLDLRYL